MVKITQNNTFNLFQKKKYEIKYSFFRHFTLENTQAHDENLEDRFKLF